MDRDTIIRLAREAGLKLFNEGWTSSDNGDAVAEESLERFAALVAAHERERICKQIAMLHDSLSLTGTANWGRT